MNLKTIRRHLRTSRETPSYPDRPTPAPPAYRGQVTLHTGRCDGNAACARACPSQAITVEPTADGWVWELDDARCVFCGLCEEACPAQAISLTSDFELAVRDPEDLVTRVIFTRGGNDRS